MDGENTAGTGNRLRRQDRTLILLLAIPAVVALWFISGITHYFLDISEASYTPYFWPRGTGLFVHASGGLIALSAGLVQLWLGLTGRTGQLHRNLGRIYVLAIAVGAAAGFYMALTIPNGIVYQAGLFTLNLAWVTCTAMAVIAIKWRNIRQHKQWMLRSYTVTFAFVVYRLVTNTVEAAGLLGAIEIGTIMAWAAWAVPLVMLEVGMQWRAISRG